MIIQDIIPPQKRVEQIPPSSFGLRRTSSPSSRISSLSSMKGLRQTSKKAEKQIKKMPRKILPGLLAVLLIFQIFLPVQIFLDPPRIEIQQAEAAAYDVTALQSLEHDGVDGTSNSLVMIDSTHFILAHSGNGSDAFVKVFTINSDTYAISQTSVLNHDAADGDYNSLVMIDSTHFILAYEGAGSDGFIKVFTIDPGNSYAITQTSVLNHDAADGDYNSLVMIDSTHFILAYEGAGSDGFIKVFTIDPGNSYAISQTSFLEHDIADGQYNSLVKIDSTHFMLAYAGSGIDGFIKVFTIDPGNSYAISQTSFLEHDILLGYYNSFVMIDSTHFMLAYAGTNDADGFIKVFTIDPGNSYAISQTSFLEHDIADGLYSSLVMIDSTHFMLAYRSTDSDGHIKVFSIDGSYVITQESSLEHDTDNAFDNSLVMIDSTHFMLAYAGDFSDGYVKTFSMESGNAAPNVPTISSPADGALEQSLTPNLVFNYSDSDADACTKFDLKVDNDIAFGSPEIDETDYSTGGPWASGGTITYPISSGLSAGTKYYWKARVYDGTVWGSWSDGSWDFTTNSVPNATSVSDAPDPVNISSDVTFTGVWTEADSADNVKMYVCKDSSCTNCNSTTATNCWCYSDTWITEPTVTDTCTYTAQSGDVGNNSYWLGSCDDSDDCDATPFSGGTFTVQPTIQFTATSSNGAESVTPVHLELTLSAVSGQDVTVNYEVTGTATGSGTDYTLANGTAEITIGNTTITIDAIIENDVIDELDETIIVTISSPSNASLGSNTEHTYTILDNDTAGITISAISGNTSETGTTATFTMVLNSEPTANVTITLCTSDDTEGTVSTDSLIFTSENWSDAQTVIVTGVDDDDNDGNIIYYILTGFASSADPNYHTINASDVTVTNTDDDSTSPAVFDLSSPSDNSWTNDSTPTLSWNASSDSESGLAKYQLYIDGALDKDNIDSSATSTTPTSFLTDGSYTWYIKAIDNAGNERQSTSTYTIKIDTIIPSLVGAPSFGAITTNSIVVNKPTIVTEQESGLYQWQVRKDNVTELGLNAISTTSITDSSLSENTQYTYDAQFKDNANNTGNYGITASKYTLADTPTNLSGTSAQYAMDLSVDSFPNATTDSSGYYFENTTKGTNSGWIQTNSWNDTGLTCNTSYAYTVKYRNGDGVETDTISLTKSTDSCGGGITPIGSQNPPEPPISNPENPKGEFKILINNGDEATNNRTVNLKLSAGSDTTKMIISENSDFKNSIQESYQETRQWSLSYGDGIKTVYVKFYTKYGVESEIVSDSIVLDTGLKKEIKSDKPEAPVKDKPAKKTSLPEKDKSTSLPKTSIKENIALNPIAIVKNLKWSSNNNQVVQLQDKLKQLNLFPKEIKSNGNFGPATRQAVKEFQKSVGIYPCGTVGPRTRKALNNQEFITNKNYQFAKDLGYNNKGEEIKQLQTRLRDQSFFPYYVKSTGWFGPITKTAVKLFQKFHGIIENGIVGELMRGRLNF